MDALTLTFGVLIGGFTLRRLAFVLAPPRRRAPSRSVELPSVVVAIAARNEQERIPNLLSALDRLDYDGPLRYLFVEDASTDKTPEILRSWTSGRSDTRLLILPKQQGKAAALNTGLTGDDAEWVYCLDADQEPAPDALTLAAEVAAGDAQLGAVCGYRRPITDHPASAARYAALEAWVHQLIVLEGKDRLHLNPASSGGNTLFRRAALDACGGFPVGSLSEDTETTLAMIARGWTTRFLRTAQAATQVPSSLDELRRQRARWTVGLYRSGSHVSGPESLVTALGYADRIAWLGAVACAAMGLIPLWIPIGYFLGPMAAVPLALYRAGVGLAFPRYIVAALQIFPLDVLWTLRTTAQRIFQPGAHRRLLGGWRGG